MSRLVAPRVRAALMATVPLLALMAPLGAGRAAAAPAPHLSAQAAILVEPTTGQRLLGIAPDARRAVASTTKLMTALVTLEHVRRLDTTFAQNDYVPAAADSQIGLVPGERMSVHDLLIALMLPSADDAAEDLAYNVGHGSVGRFVAMMNVRARQLGLSHTHYTTPIGLDTTGNYSSASDLVKLAGFLLSRHAFMARVVALPRAVLHTGRTVRVVANRNDLVGAYHWINGVKTGHTLQAGYVLVGSARRGGMSLLSAVLGTGSEYSRDANTLALLRYGFAEFRLAHPVRSDELLARPTVADRSGVRTQLVAAAPFTRVVPRGARVSLQVVAPGQLAGPLPRRSAHGFVRVLVDGRPVGRVPLVLPQALPAVSPLTQAARALTAPPALVLVVLACAAGAAAAVWRRRRREREQRGALQA